jgi:hypothetical protein
MWIRSLSMQAGIDETARWFTADFTGRALSVPEQAFVKALTEMLDRVRPAQVLPADTNLTAEGVECLIAIIPHAFLAGVSIIIWLEPDEIIVMWAQVHGLKYHDDIDDADWVHRFFKKEPLEAWHAEAVHCVEEQLSRPIQVVATYGRGDAEPMKVKFFLSKEGQASERIGSKIRVPLWSRVLSWPRRTDRYTVRFTDRDRPRGACPVNVADWYAF